jgi:hypothetical protein
MSWIKTLNYEKIISNLAIFYIIFGFIFALIYAVNYHWSFFTFMSPAFLNVMLLWPFQTPGFINDVLFYGFGGKPV